jgi:hypothetical protein
MPIIIAAILKDEGGRMKDELRRSSVAANLKFSVFKLRTTEYQFSGLQAAFPQGKHEDLF